MKRGKLKRKRIKRTLGRIIRKTVPNPKKTKIGLWREWLVPDGAYHRYEGLRGVYWYWLSREIRQNEWEKWDGRCLTCLEPLEDWRQGQCGHIVASAGCGEYLRFNPINLTLQHDACNNPRFTPNASALNAVHYDQRYGDGAWEKLYAMRKLEAKHPTQAQYRTLISNLNSFKEAFKMAQQSLTLKE